MQCGSEHAMMGDAGATHIGVSRQPGLPCEGSIATCASGFYTLNCQCRECDAGTFGANGNLRCTRPDFVSFNLLMGRKFRATTLIFISSFSSICSKDLSPLPRGPRLQQLGCHQLPALPCRQQQPQWHRLRGLQPGHLRRQCRRRLHGVPRRACGAGRGDDGLPGVPGGAPQQLGWSELPEVSGRDLSTQPEQQ